MRNGLLIKELVSICCYRFDFSNSVCILWGDVVVRLWPREASVSVETVRIFEGSEQRPKQFLVPTQQSKQFFIRDRAVEACRLETPSKIVRVLHQVLHQDNLPARLVSLQDAFSCLVVMSTLTWIFSIAMVLPYRNHQVR